MATPPPGLEAIQAAQKRFNELRAAADAKDERGRTMLMLAAAADGIPVEIVSALLKRGVDVNATTADGETALGHALKRGNTPVVDLLRKAGAREATVSRITTSKPAPASSTATSSSTPRAGSSG